jgi:hypothetical protein
MNFDKIISKSGPRENEMLGTFNKWQLIDQVKTQTFLGKKVIQTYMNWQDINNEIVTEEIIKNIAAKLQKLPDDFKMSVSLFYEQIGLKNERVKK